VTDLSEVSANPFSSAEDNIGRCSSDYSFPRLELTIPSFTERCCLSKAGSGIQSSNKKDRLTGFFVFKDTKTWRSNSSRNVRHGISFRDEFEKNKRHKTIIQQ
jgi:hypothetical protein